MLKATIEFNSSVEIEIENSTHIEEIIDDYAGDFKAWLNDNWTDIIHHTDIEHDFHFADIYLEGKEEDRQSFLKQQALALGFNEDFTINQTHFTAKQMFNHVVNNVDLKDYIEIKYLDLKALKYLESFTDYNNPRVELNTVLFDKDRFVATDTRKLAVVPTSIKSDTQVFIPRFFIQPLLDGGILYLSKENDAVLLSYKEHFYLKNIARFRYPEYKRIIIEKFENTCSFEEFKKSMKKDEENNLAYYNDTYFNLDYSKLVLGCPYKLEDVYIPEKMHPLAFRSDECYIMIMPIEYKK